MNQTDLAGETTELAGDPEGEPQRPQLTVRELNRFRDLRRSAEALPMLSHAQVCHLIAQRSEFSKEQFIILPPKRGGGAIRVPAFQFSLHGERKLPVRRRRVMELNQRLSIATQPWMAAAFWAHTYPQEDLPLYKMANDRDCIVRVGYHISGINVCERPHPAIVSGITLDEWLEVCALV